MQRLNEKGQPIQRLKEKGHTVKYNTLHRKQKIKQNEPQ